MANKQILNMGSIANSGTLAVPVADPANPAVDSYTVAGSVTSVATGTGLTGGPVTGAGTVSFAAIAAGDFLANTGTASAAPVATVIATLSAGNGIQYSAGGPYTPAVAGTLAVNLVPGANITITNGNTIAATSPAGSTFAVAMAALSAGSELGAI